MTRVPVFLPQRTFGAALVLAGLCLAKLLLGTSSSGAAGPPLDGADGLSGHSGQTGLAGDPLAAPDGLALAGRPGGYVGAVIADGAFALASFDHRLYRYDLSDPREPRAVASGPFVGANSSLLPGNLSRLIQIDGPAEQGQAGQLQVGLVDWDRGALVWDFSRLQLVLLRDLSVVGQLELPGFTTAPHRGLAVVTELAPAGDDHVLVAETEADGQHVRVVDISRPEQPRLVGDYRPSGPVAGMAVRDDLAYVLVHSARLVVLDLSTPASPRPLAELPAVGGAMDLVLVGPQAFVMGCDGLAVFDLADPALPRQVGPILPLVDPPAPPGGGPTPVPSSGGMSCRSSANLQWKDGRLYVLTAVDSFIPFQSSHVLWTIDVSRPEAPRVVSQRGGESEASGLAVGDGFAVLGDAHQGFGIVDLTDPDQPVEAGVLVPESMVQGPVAAEPDLVVQSLTEGWVGELRFIDPRPPWRGSADAGQPASLGRLALPDMVLATDLALEDGMAYALMPGKGLLIVDARNPRAPRRTALVPQRATGIAVAVRRGVAYVAEADKKGPAGILRVIDARDPANPVETATFPGTVDDLAVWGDLLVAAVADPPSLTLYDLRDPAHPAQIGSLPLAAPARRITAQGDRIYLLAGGAVVVVDSSDPAAPRLRGRLGLDLRGDFFPFGGPQDLAARGAVVYLGNHSTLQTIDASDPDAPMLLNVRIINSFINLLPGPTEDWMPTGGFLAAAGDQVHLAGDKTGLWSFGAGTPGMQTTELQYLFLPQVSGP